MELKLPVFLFKEITHNVHVRVHCSITYIAFEPADSDNEAALTCFFTGLGGGLLSPATLFEVGTLTAGMDLQYNKYPESRGETIIPNTRVLARFFQK